MLKHSKAMLVLKAQAQDVLNFTVLVCHAVPSLNAYMKAVEKSNPDTPKLPDPDHFAVDTHVNLRKYREAYKKTIGRFILISSFSYFEAYVKNLVDELVAFHGGPTSLVETVKKRLSRSYPEELRKKLQTTFKSNRINRYENVISELRNRGYPFPTDLFSVYGMITASRIPEELRAADIPGLLNDLFFFEMEDTSRKQYDRLREKRNEIAHGRFPSIELKEALSENRFLRDLSVKIDNYVVQNFFVIEDNHVNRKRL